MVEIILSIWDLGGQERFDVMKKKFFAGTAATALCFDLSRPDTFKKLDYYLSETRKSAGDIPILLVGNKADLEDELGQMISIEEINEWMRNNQITDFVKTSAKTNYNVDIIFQKLSLMALLDLQEIPRYGEFREDQIFRFKITLAGAGGVGKTSITQRFTNNLFADNYSLTVGVDFLTKKMVIDDETLPEEIIEKIKDLKKKQEEKIIKGRKQLALEMGEGYFDDETKSLGGIDLDGISKVDKSDSITSEVDEISAEDTLIEEDDLEDSTEIPKMPPKPSKELISGGAPPGGVPSSGASIPPPGAGVPPVGDLEKPPLTSAKDSSVEAPKPAPPPAPKLAPPSAPKPAPPAPPTPSTTSAPSIKSEQKIDLKIKRKAGIKKEKRSFAEKQAKPSPKKVAAPTIEPPLEKEVSRLTEAKPSPMDQMKKEEKKLSVKAEESYDMRGDETEEYIETEKILERKTTVFYKKQMNPLTHNPLRVILSTKKIYERLKKLKTEEKRVSTGETLVFKESSPYVSIEPYFPGCVCSPGRIILDARKEKDEAVFDITPLATGDIDEACVRLYYEDELIETIKTPTKVVKQTIAKISAFLGVILPLFENFFNSTIGSVFPSIVKLWDQLGGTDGFLLILSGISFVISGLFSYLKKSKDADPIEADFPTFDELVARVHKETE